MKKLIVIEGFDRTGKDTLLKDLYNINLPNTYIYFNDLEDLPDYNDQDDFLEWLNKFIVTQINMINELFEDYDNIIMTRFIITDEVYSTLFDREHTVLKYLEDLRDDIEIYNYCLLFKDYDEYLKRLKIIKDDDVQYSKEDFDKINNLYKEILNDYNSYIEYITADTSREFILKSFLN